MTKKVFENFSKEESFLAKCKAVEKPPERVHTIELFWSAVGSFSGIGMVSFLTLYFDVPILVASFGASSVLLYGAIESPLAQPRNAIGGQLVSALTGVLFYQIWGMEWWTVALAVALSISLMHLTRTLHPPGGATAIVAVYSGQSWSFVFAPVLVGMLILVAVAILTNNLAGTRRYPRFWC